MFQAREVIMYHINQTNNYQLILLQSFLNQLGFFFYKLHSPLASDKTQLEVMFNENAADIIFFFLLRYKYKAFWLVDLIFICPSRDGPYYVIGYGVRAVGGGRPLRFPHNNFRSKVMVSVTINRLFDNRVVSTQ